MTRNTGLKFAVHDIFLKDLLVLQYHVVTSCFLYKDLTTDIKLFVDPSDTKASQLKLVFDPKGNMVFLQTQETKKM